MLRRLVAVTAGVTLVIVGVVLGYRMTHRVEVQLPSPSPAVKIAKAYNLAPELRASLDRIETYDDPEGVRNFQQQLEVRLRLREQNCANANANANAEAEAEAGAMERVKKQIDRPACLARQDQDIAAWVKLMEIGLLLRQPPLRPIPSAPAAELRADDNIYSVDFAAQAGVGLFHTAKSIQLLDIGSGEVLHSEPGNRRSSGRLSANGRLFVTSSLPQVASIVETATGRTLLEIPDPDVAAYKLSWLDERTAFYYSGMDTRFIDFSRGQYVQTDIHLMLGRAVAVPGKADHYVIVEDRKQAVEVQLVQRDTTPQLKVLRRIDASTRDFLGFSTATNQSQLGIDGNTYLSPNSNGGVGLLSLQDLQPRNIETGRFEVLRVVPTLDPEKLIFNGRLLPDAPVVDDVFVVDVPRQRLAPVDGGRRRWERLEYVAPLKRLGIIKNNTFRLIDELPVGKETSVSEWRERMTAEAAPRRNMAVNQGNPLYRYAMPRAPTSSSDATAQTAPQVSTNKSSSVATGSADSPTQAEPRVVVNTSVEVIGVYQSTAGKTGSGVHLPGVIDVDVGKTRRPLTLVLSSHEPITWKLHRQPGSQVHQVLLCSHYRSTVEGAGDAKVIAIDIDNSYQSSGYQQLPAAVVNLTGQTTGLFQGAYSGERFSVGKN